MLLDITVQLPAAQGGTRAHIRVWASNEQLPAVALVTEDGNNPGLSADRVFGRLVDRVVTQLATAAASTEGVLWVYRWEQRAISSVLIADAVTLRDHVMLPEGSQWLSLPLPGTISRQLIPEPQHLAQPAAHTASADPGTPLPGSGPERPA